MEHRKGSQPREQPQPAPIKPDWLAQADRLSWEWVDGKLEGARDIWLVTTRADGKPQARPVWGQWDADAYFLSVGGGGLKRLEDIEGSPASIHLDSAAEVVILEGTLAVLQRKGGSFDVADDRLARVLERWNIKYGKSWTLQENGFNVVLIPDVVLSWRENEARTDAEASGKWSW